MTTVLLVLEFIVALALIGVVLLQRSEGGGLGIGSSQGMGSFMTGRGTANLLTRSTAVLATLFFVLAILLGVLNRGATQGGGSSILDAPPTAVPPASNLPSMNQPPTAAPPAGQTGGQSGGQTGTVAPGTATPPATTVPAAPTPAAPAQPAAPTVPNN